MLTNQAAYWPGHKLGLFDSVTTERMPIAEVVSVSLRTELYLGRLIVGGILFVSGVIVAILLTTAQSWDVGDMKNILGLAIGPCVWLIGFGLYVATQGGWRRTLAIASENREFRWAEPHTFGGTIKAQVSVAFQQVWDWAQRNDLNLEADSTASG